jgi:hypothetical protein
LTSSRRGRADVVAEEGNDEEREDEEDRIGVLGAALTGVAVPLVDMGKKCNCGPK